MLGLHRHRHERGFLNSFLLWRFCLRECVFFLQWLKDQKCRHHSVKKQQDPNGNPESTSWRKPRYKRLGPLGAFVAFLSFHLVSSPARGRPVPRPRSNPVRGSGCLQGNRDWSSCCFRHPPSPVSGPLCNRKTRKRGACLLMRRNHWPGGSADGASHRASSSPLLWVRGQRCTEAPDGRFTGPAERGATGRYKRGGGGEQVAMATQVKAQSAQGQPGFCLLVGRASSSGWRVV